MQRQEESLKEIQSKLNEINQVKIDLKATNEFKPNLTLPCPKPGKAKSDPNAFIFSLTNKDNEPLKMKVNPNRHQHAIGCGSRWGPTFGIDICMVANPDFFLDPD